MITVAVCDDDKLFSAAILDKITDIAVKRNIDLDVKLFDSASSLYKAVKDGACFDIIFFDVLIGSENGIEAARGLRELCEGTLFIFLSGYIDFAVQGYEVRAFRYLLKDRIDTDLEKTLVEALSELKKKPMYSFSYKNAVYRISLDSILYFESDKRLVLAHTRQKDYCFYGRLDEVEKETGFIRIHKSYLVNQKYIESLAKTELHLMGGIVLNVSKTYADAAKHKFMLGL